MIRCLLLVLIYGAVVACSSIRMENECTYVREVKTTYVCQPEGKVEHIRLAPTAPD